MLKNIFNNAIKSDELIYKTLSNHGGPLHYLGNRYLKLPDSSGHMVVDNAWLKDFFDIIFANFDIEKINKCYEPFAGSASWSIAAMELGLAKEYVINDSNNILINTHILMRDNPNLLKKSYEELLNKYNQTSSKQQFFLNTINDYNLSDNHQKSLLLPFIINHSWGGMLFYDKAENIITKSSNISLEKANLTLDMYFQEVDRVSKLYNSNNVKFQSGDFCTCLSDIEANDFVALNPPYPENERSAIEKTSMYTELYSPEILHSNIIDTILKIENIGCPYFMTYGFYNPEMKQFVLYDNKNTYRKNYFRLIGDPDCAFGMALDQIYLSPKLPIPEHLNNKFIPASKVLKDQELTPKEALDIFTLMNKNNNYIEQKINQ